MDIEAIAVSMYKVFGNHRTVQQELAKRGCRIKLVLIMLWLDIITPEQYVRFTTT